MCGIIGVANFDGHPVNKVVKKQYFKQKSRGSDGFGIFDYEYKNLIREPQEKNIIKWLKRYPSSAMLFHHRFPTSTANVRNACHPFSTKDFFKTNYVLIHNGVLHNEFELYEKHEAMGIKYTSVQPDGSFNDSEALLWEVALYLEGKQDKIEAEGSIAFICMAIGKGNKHDRIWFARNNNPLNMKLTDGSIMLSSEGNGEPIDNDKLYSFDFVNKKLTTKPLELDTGYTYIPDSSGSRSYSRDSDWWINYSDAYGYYDAQGYYHYYEDDDELAEVSAQTTLDDMYGSDRTPTLEKGRAITLVMRTGELAKQTDEALVTNRILRANNNWLWESIEQCDYEYDCVAMYDNYLLKNNLPRHDSKYTLAVYTAVALKLEDYYDSSDSYQGRLLTPDRKE